MVTNWSDYNSSDTNEDALANHGLMATYYDHDDSKSENVNYSLDFCPKEALINLINEILKKEEWKLTE